MDHQALNRGIALRKAEARRLQTEITLACEKAASRSYRNRQLPADPSDWDHATWDRYLSEAARMEHCFGDRLRKIFREIQALERLAAMPLAA